jgi:hypothetical protein
MTPADAVNYINQAGVTAVGYNVNSATANLFDVTS